MWYFAWMLGLPLAAVFAVVNAMWLEMQHDRALWEETDQGGDDGPKDPTI